jgi:DNA polymerase III delta prime subunit
VDGIDPQQLARALIDLQEWAGSVRFSEPSDGLPERLREHLGGEAKGLPVVSRALEGYQRANFQVAIDHYLGVPDRHAELIGLPETHGYRVGLAELVKGGAARWGEEPDEFGPVEYEPVDIAEERIMCVSAGLWLIEDGERRLVLMLRRSDHGPQHSELGIEIMAPGREAAEALLAEIERLMREHNPYRGRVLVLSSSPWGGIGVEVQRLPDVTREQIVFPDGVLERIERHTKTFSEHAAELKAAGRHLKRGLLLHGPPGTGKTLTVMYLSGLMPERTTLLLTGNALGAVGAACEMARELAPAMLVMEDVDLVAEDRTRGRPTTILLELLNQLDGLNEDVDIVFVLTTNRPEVVEPALASRPGRVDLAVNMPLPDETGRARLLALYGRGLELQLSDEASFIAATVGCTPAFIREALRRAALLGLERGGEQPITDELLRSAIEELRDGSDALTRSLLGAGRSPEGESTA